MSEKRYDEMDNEELAIAHNIWENKVATAPGFPSAHFAAKQVEAIVRESDKRGIGLVNHYPIMVGTPPTTKPEED